VFRIGIVGNDVSLNKFTCCMASLFHSHNDVLSQLGNYFFSQLKFNEEKLLIAFKIFIISFLIKLDFRVYYIPVERSTFADWLGRQDPWYGRNVSCLVSGLCKTYPSIIQLIANPTVLEARLSTKRPQKPRTPEQLNKKNSSTVISSPPVPDRAKVISQNPIPTQMDGALAEMQRRMAFNKPSEGFRSGVSPRAAPAPAPNAPTVGAKRSPSLNVRHMEVAPNFTIRTEMNDYFRDAKHLVKVAVFNCECWNDDTLRSDLSFPFIQHVEIGLNVETKALQVCFIYYQIY
jgi:hypothetical protein